MTRNFFFWGVIDGDDSDEIWKTLHDHFEALARADDDGMAQTDPEDVFTERKAAKRK